MGDAAEKSELSEELEERLRRILARILARTRVEEVIDELRRRPRVKLNQRSPEAEEEAMRILKKKGII